MLQSIFFQSSLPRSGSTLFQNIVAQRPDFYATPTDGTLELLYAARQNLKTLVVTKDIGGQALLTDYIENFPGYEPIGGFELMSKFEEQAKSFGAQFVYDEVISITKKRKMLHCQNPQCRVRDMHTCSCIRKDATRHRSSGRGETER